MSCGHTTTEQLVTEGGGVLAQRCTLCLATWAMRSCAACPATFRLIDRRSLRRKHCQGEVCRKAVRNARDRARRAAAR